MPAEIIDLLSSDPVQLPPSSPPRVSKPALRRDSFQRLSDDLEIPHIQTRYVVESWKRRRLTPPPARPSAAGNATRRSPRNAGKAAYTFSSPIVLSSPPVARRPQDNVSTITTTETITKQPFDIFDDLDEFDNSPQRPQPSMHYTSKTAALLANLDGNRLKAQAMAPTFTKTKLTKAAATAKAMGKAKASASPLSSIEDPSSQVMPLPAKRKARLTTPEKYQTAKDKAQEKAAAAAARAFLKAEQKREKQLKADLVEVNKARHDKKVSVGEMVLRVSEKFFEKSVGELTRTVMQDLEVQVDSDATVIMPGLEDVLTWRRKVRARFDDGLGHWVPLGNGRTELQDEKSHVLCVLEASTFAKMIRQCTNDDNGSGENILGLDAHARTLKRRWPTSRPIYLIEGLEALSRKCQNAKNKSYQAAVRAQHEVQAAPENSQNKRKRKQKEQILIDPDELEDAMLRLQVEHSCLIHHTTKAVETAQWIGNFTQHISTIPYRNQQNNTEASFCMDVGQVRTGDDKDDTFVKMLQEIVRVTLPIAYGVAAKYPSAFSLVDAMRLAGPVDGRLILANLKKCSNKNGSFTDATIGEALSKRLYNVFMGTDPDSTQV